MVRKSYGKMRGTRFKLKTRKKPTLTQYLEKYDLGENVRILYFGSRFQHPRFQGRIGKIVGKSGRSYVVQVRDQAALKKVYVRPEHLKR